MTRKLSLDLGLLVAILISIFAIYPLLAHDGLPNTADGPVHLMRQVELNQAWQDGIIYPRWAADLAYGYGMPLFHYAPPLLYHVTQLFHMTGMELDTAMKSTIIFMIILCSVGMYLFGRDMFSPQVGLLTSAVYLYAPYRLREIYIQGNYGQFCGLSFYPLIFWSFYNLIRTQQWRYICFGALSLTGLLLSHNISFMLFVPLFGGYVILLLILKKENRIKSFLLIILTGLFGLGLSAFFWLPAFGERNFIRLAGITQGFFDFRHNFITFSELIALPQALDLSAINPYYPSSLGIAQITFFILAMLVFSYVVIVKLMSDAPVDVHGETKLALSLQLLTPIFFLMALIFYSFMTLPQSQWLWENIPLVSLTEFPWRMLGPAIFCVAVLAGATAHVVGQVFCHASQVSCLRYMGFAILFTLAVNGVYLVPAQFITWGTPTLAQAISYEVQSGAIGTTSTGEFLPKWADHYPTAEILLPDYTSGRLPTKLDPASLPDGSTATMLTNTAHETQIAIDSPQPFLATFRTLYWLGWKVLVNEQPIDNINITKPDGLIQAPLPSGKYIVTLRLTNTPIRHLANIISWGTLLLFVVTIFYLSDGYVLRKPHKPVRYRNMTYSVFPTKEAIWIAGLLIITFIISRSFVDWFQVKSPLDHVYKAQYPLQADFGDEMRLLAFDQSRTELTSHDTFPVTLYWRSLQNLTTNYRIFVHLDAPNGQTYMVADVENPADIPTSHLPSGMYLRHPFNIDIPTNMPPIRYEINVGVYHPNTWERLPLTACETCSLGKDKLTISYMWILPDSAIKKSQILHLLNYRFGKSITLHGYDLSSHGDSYRFTLYWQTESILKKNYTVFIHAIDTNGQITAQFDNPPLHGLYPTTAWLPNIMIADSHTIAINESVTHLMIGLYNESGRLAILDGQGHKITDDAIGVDVVGKWRY